MLRYGSTLFYSAGISVFSVCPATCAVSRTAFCAVVRPVVCTLNGIVPTHPRACICAKEQIGRLMYHCDACISPLPSFGSREIAQLVKIYSSLLIRGCEIVTSKIRHPLAMQVEGGENITPFFLTRFFGKELEIFAISAISRDTHSKRMHHYGYNLLNI